MKRKERKETEKKRCVFDGDDSWLVDELATSTI